MFCSQCRAQLSDDARFCERCGAAIFSTSKLDLSRVTDVPEDQPPMFGTPTTRWWGSFVGREEFKNTFPVGYEWIQERNTLLVCPEHLVLLRGDGNRSDVLEVIQHMGLVGGVVGVIRGVKDLIGNKQLNFSGEAVSKLFRDKLLVWCKKSDAVIWKYNEKPWLLIRSSSEQLYCPFVSEAGILHSFFVLWCTARSLGQSKGKISELGCPIKVVAENIPEKDVHEAMLASRLEIVV